MSRRARRADRPRPTTESAPHGGALRLLLYLGKGGVGKTTVAAATAARCAELGHRTLVVSTDIAHSLADVLDQPLGAEPVAVAPQLWAQEINVVDEIQNHWHELRDYFAALMRHRGLDEVIAEELAVVPGMEEVVSLLHIYRQGAEGNFDVLVVDAAPTGETVRLLTLPESFRWYLGRFGQVGEQALKVAHALGFLPANTDDVMDLLDRLEREVAELRRILVDPERSSYRVVLNPEKMVIRETQRAITYLNLFGYPVDAGIVNRVLPAEPSPDPYLRRLQDIQKRYLAQIEATFSPLPLFYVPWQPEEMIGPARLRQLAEGLWGERDPTSVFWRGPVQEIVERGEAYLLRLPLPHVEMDKVEMTKRGDELFITIGNFKRELILPYVLASRQATTARLGDDGILEVRFVN
jgi:arsenite-transporting ATPase